MAVYGVLTLNSPYVYKYYGADCNICRKVSREKEQIQAAEIHRDDSKKTGWWVLEIKSCKFSVSITGTTVKGWNFHLINCRWKIKFRVLVEYFVLTQEGYFFEWLYVRVYDAWNVHKKHDKFEKMTQTGRSDDINGCREIELSKPLKKLGFQSYKKRSYFIESEFVFRRYRRRASVPCSSAGCKIYTSMHRLYRSCFWFLILWRRFNLQSIKFPFSVN